MPTSRSELSERVDVIERGYEYLLAYAAQGRQDDAGSEVRDTLTKMHAALAGLAEGLAARLAEDLAGGSAEESREALLKAHPDAAEAAPPDAAAFFDAFREDARKARGAIALVLSRPKISSLLVDNLNASIHLRALLTDIFLAEQALK